jgi:hypothetical protein
MCNIFRVLEGEQNDLKNLQSVQLVLLRLRDAQSLECILTRWLHRLGIVQCNEIMFLSLGYAWCSE